MDDTLITSTTIDRLYDHAVVDNESYQSTPARHYRVSGHFVATMVRFNFYLPPKSAWGGRFFQFAFPVQSENATDETVGFALDSQAYAVQVTGVRGFHAEAAAARFSRRVAARYYGAGSRRIYGYLYGGSGGSLQVIGAMEGSTGIWDGAVPFVQAIPISAPNNLSIRAMASLVLRGKAAEMQDALASGGSGDPFVLLDAVERDMLREVTKLGVPIQTWEDFSKASDTKTLAVLTNEIIRVMDPTYADDFWTKPGYLGTEQSSLGDIFRDAMVNFEATLKEVVQDGVGIPVSMLLETTKNPLPSTVCGKEFYDFEILARDSSILGVLVGKLDPITKIATIDSSRNNHDICSLARSLTKGTKIRVDNKWSLAMRAYYRYQVPDGPGYYGFDQLRQADGSPKFPQRQIDASRMIAKATTGGATHTGRINGKVIVIQNLLDSDAFPWHADWYRSQVKRALGARFDDNYRLWYNENTDHSYDGPKEPSTRGAFIVQYRGICQQALRDLSAWVEEGISPPNSTSYRVAEDSSIRMPTLAAERGGIQPTVWLTVEGGRSFEAQAGQSVTFRGTVSAPPGAGKVVFMEWDFFGQGCFVPGSPVVPGETVEVSASFTYQQEGACVVSLRATSQRQGDRSAAYTRVMNLDRVSVRVGSPGLGAKLRL
ncbi:pkd domain containing protein [Colletotrichum sojae]|uniref:Pkd domain containing protein n=1 Tax=Colletotrichum sojae TaxID=2175907 RepID=A0A8H6IVD9_9PEZI|nr:pkd domain containing protein [Colletotrichum sojae]